MESSKAVHLAQMNFAKRKPIGCLHGPVRRHPSSLLQALSARLFVAEEADGIDWCAVWLTLSRPAAAGASFAVLCLKNVLS
ncbi:hypothetical protein PoB_001185700 [Plakobranchus ocellatus]|uniref:Uncharacterized protein n=1 Tax=Plakobranchus ocellatus TaxID=259542 RepID=A0AAV3YQZ4_9GAST|nr:hypothetical protein PoB_001185700 [Plakobranchus ocellatus]